MFKYLSFNSWKFWYSRSFIFTSGTIVFFHPSADVMQKQGQPPSWSYTSQILWGWKTVAEILPPALFSQWRSAFCRTLGLIEFSVVWGMWQEPCRPVEWESVDVLLPASLSLSGGAQMGWGGRCPRARQRWLDCCGDTTIGSTHRLSDCTGGVGSGFLWCMTASSLVSMECVIRSWMAKVSMILTVPPVPQTWIFWNFVWLQQPVEQQTDCYPHPGLGGEPPGAHPCPQQEHAWMSLGVRTGMWRPQKRSTKVASSCELIVCSLFMIVNPAMSFMTGLFNPLRP